MKKKEPRTKILYARIAETNSKWIKDNMKKLGYKSKSEYVNLLFNQIRNKKATNAGNKRKTA